MSSFSQGQPRFSEAFVPDPLTWPSSIPRVLPFLFIPMTLLFHIFYFGLFLG
jgi:hypothetical protein